MTRISAGLLAYRRRAGRLEVFLVHPGGPYWAGKDRGAWSIPKGLAAPGEDLLAAARRECAEETGLAPPGPFLPLTPRQQKSGKVIHAWACDADFDPERLQSNTFTLEWPPRSGRLQAFPEADRAGWFSLPAAEDKIVPGQAGFLEELAARLDEPGPCGSSDPAAEP